MLNPVSLVRFGRLREMESGKEWVLDTVKAQSSGPEVERGRWPNLGLVFSFEREDMLREDI